MPKPKKRKLRVACYSETVGLYYIPHGHCPECGHEEGHKNNIAKEKEWVCECPCHRRKAK